MSHILLCPIVLHPRIIRHHSIGSYRRISSRSSCSVLSRCLISGWMLSDRLIRETKSRMNSLWIVDERAAAPGQSQAGAASDRTSLFQRSSWIPQTTLTLPNQCKANTYSIFNIDHEKPWIFFPFSSWCDIISVVSARQTIWFYDLFLFFTYTERKKRCWPQL